MDQRTFAYCDCQTGWQTFAVFFAVGGGITRPSGRRLPFFAVGRGIARPSGRRLPFFAVGRVFFVAEDCWVSFGNGTR